MIYIRKQINLPPVTKVVPCIGIASYKRTDDPYGTFDSESSTGGTFGPGAGKVPQGVYTPPDYRLHRYRMGAAFSMPQMAGYTITSALLNISVLSYTTALESFTPKIFLSLGDYHAFGTGWWDATDLTLAAIALATGSQSISLSTGSLGAFSNSYMNLILASGGEVNGTGAGGDSNNSAKFLVDSASYFNSIQIILTLQP